MEIDFLQRITLGIGKLQVKYPYRMAAAILIFTLLILPGMTLIFFDNSNENFLPENDPVVDSLFTIGTDFSGGFNSLQYIFFLDAKDNQTIPDLRDPVFLKKIDTISKGIESLYFVDTVNTPTTKIKELNHGVIPATREEIITLIDENPSLRAYYNGDYQVMRIFVISPSFGSTSPEQQTSLNQLDGHIETIGLPGGVTYKAWGDIIQFLELDENIAQGLVSSTIIAFLAIFTLIVIFYRSIVSGILSIFPIVISLIWTMGAMGYIHLPFTVLTSGFIPLVMGLGIDYSIHLIHSIRHLQAEGKTVDEAVVATMEEVGEAITAATITTAVGFFSLLLASLLVTQRLGLTLTISVVFIFVGCILIVPLVLIIQERIKKRWEHNSNTRKESGLYA